jgi:hypothetical protein
MGAPVGERAFAGKKPLNKGSTIHASTTRREQKIDLVACFPMVATSPGTKTSAAAQ